MAPVSQQHAHPAGRPIAHRQVRNVLPFRSIPSSNSAGRKFHALLSVTPAKPRSRRCEAHQQDGKAVYPVHAVFQDPWLVSMANSLRQTDCNPKLSPKLIAMLRLADTREKNL